LVFAAGAAVKVTRGVVLIKDVTVESRTAAGAVFPAGSVTLPAARRSFKFPSEQLVAVTVSDKPLADSTGVNTHPVAAGLAATLLKSAAVMLDASIGSLKL
jgi:hypothetical protein